MKKIYSLFLFTVFSLLVYTKASAQTVVVTYTADATWTCPVGVTSITVECWGAGGGGGGAKKRADKFGTGGGGGAYARSTVVVVPGNNYAVVVGTGGAQGTGTANAGNGGSSTFNATSVVAAGGGGGLSATDNSTNPSTAGAGGTVAASTGTVEFAGGNGAVGAIGAAGGGGGGAGTTAVGAAAAGSTAGAGGTLLGGAGGNGSTVATGPGATASVYGGAGGGATDNNTGAKRGGTGASGLVRITYSTTPPNDNCSGAIGLTHQGEGSCTPLAVSLTGSTSSMADAGCGASATDDLWYKFTATATRCRISVTTAGKVVELFTGATCATGATVSLGCSSALDNDFTGLTIGTEYFFRIYSSSGSDALNVCVTTQPGPPVNDDCAGAIALTASSICNYVQYTNALATASTAPDPACNYTTGTGSGVNDVWFSVVVPANGTITIDTQEGVLTDADIALYTGTCGTLAYVDCDNQASANGAMGLITRAGLTPGTTVYIRVWDRGHDAEGTFGICVTTPGGCTFSGTQTTDLGANTGECFVSCPSTLTLRDPGGAANYANSLNVTQTFTNATGGPLQISFSAFATESCCDKLYIYDGNSTAAPQWVGSPWGGTTAPPTLISSGASITIRFTSDGSINNTGFVSAITCLPACTGTPGAGNAIANPTSVCAGASSLLQVTSGIALASGYTYQWQSAPAVGGPWTNIAGATTGTYLITPAATAFYRRITTCTATGNSNLATPPGTVQVTVTGLTAACYCASGQTSSGDMEITQVILPHTGGAAATNRVTAYNGVTLGHNDPAFTGATTPNLMQSSTVTLTVGVTQGDFSYSFQVWAYFDWNQNGSFTDPGEYFQVKPYGTSTAVIQTNYTFPVTVPSTALLGNTQMRIIAVESSTNPWNPCGTFTWGEKEDYRINITAMPACAGVIDAGATVVTPTSSCNTAPVSPSMSLVGNTAASGITYQWQSAAFAAGPYTNINGAIAPTHTLTNTISNDTYFRCTLVCTNGGSTDLSTPANVTFFSGPANDLPCNATLLTMGSYMPGDNYCAGSASEPAAIGCWTTGVLNTVWYRFVATSTSAKIKTYGGTLVATQINLYTGACAGLTVVTGGCQEDFTSCSISQQLNELTVTGLTNGQTYYIRVDGDNDDFGTFTILVLDGATPFPTSPGQDCLLANPVCAMTQTISDPGFQGTGAVCEFTGINNCTSGERGSGYYEININNSGANGNNLEFTITPNDGSTDYDFLLYGPNPNCSNLETDVPIRCNFSGIGTTGLRGATDFNPDAAFMARLPVSNGQRYILVIQNFTNSTSGFTIDYAGPINATPPVGASLNWTGGVGKDWTNTTNWGGCNIPDCTRDAVIPVFANQPQVTAAMGTVTVKNLTINSGATLTLAAGATLRVCGSLYNNGTIVASPTSTILFSDDVTTHTLSGNFVGTSKLGNLTITDATTGDVNNCKVLAASNVEVGGNFTTSNVKSIFDANGKTITVGGHFANSTAGTTYLNANQATSHLIFNGTAAQNYTAGGILTHNNVTMNHTGTGVTLVGNRLELGTAGILTLNTGRIITGAQEVRVLNTAAAAVTAGNTASFVQGNLRRSLPASSTGSYNFPVGGATKAYQLANLDFTSTSTINNLLAFFTETGVASPAAVECAWDYNIACLDNGFWTINAFSDLTPTAIGATALGSYTTTLYPTNYTNGAASSQFTVYKRTSGTWAFNGTCSNNASAAAVIRAGMNGFSDYTVAQSATPLAVKLLNFTGKAIGMQNHLEWNTSAELNSDYFMLQRSKDGLTFEDLTKVKAQGKSSNVVNYEEIDREPFETTYYRLKLVDTNGDFYTSKMVILTLPVIKFDVGIRPNPAINNIVVDVFASNNTDAEIQIMDMVGKIVLTKTTTLEAGNNSIENDLGDLSRGSYFIKVTSAKGVLYNGKFVKQ
ncbi:MAG: GEVED domain-containing protein [Bacteroidota bacterium]